MNSIKPSTFVFPYWEIEDITVEFSKLPDGTTFVDYQGTRWVKVNEADEYNAVLVSDSNVGGLFKEDYLCRVEIK